MSSSSLMRYLTERDADKLRSFLRSKAADEDIKEALQTLDRLTQDELKNVAAQTLGVVSGEQTHSACNPTYIEYPSPELKRSQYPNISQYCLEALRLSGRCPTAERYSKLALPPGSVEKLQHCLWFTTQGDRVVVS